LIENILHEQTCTEHTHTKQDHTRTLDTESEEVVDDGSMTEELCDGNVSVKKTEHNGHIDEVIVKKAKTKKVEKEIVPET